MSAIALSSTRVGWLQERFAANVHWLHGHGIRGDFHAEAGLHVDARNCDRQMSAHGNLPEESARHGNLRDVADAECGKPRLRLREALDQIRAAKAEGDDRLAAVVHALGERGLFGRNIHIALAVAHTDKQRERSPRHRCRVKAASACPR